MTGVVPGSKCQVSSSPRFFADVMLGTLAKWLRILGYDTEYDNQISDGDLAGRCLAEERILLTRDVRLVERRNVRHQCILISSDHLEQQVKQVLETLPDGPLPEILLTRCVDCNRELVRVDRESVFSEVPPYVFEKYSAFKRCPDCRRVFWRGTHRDDMLARLLKLSGSADLCT